MRKRGNACMAVGTLLILLSLALFLYNQMQDKMVRQKAASEVEVLRGYLEQETLKRMKSENGETLEDDGAAQSDKKKDMPRIEALQTEVTTGEEAADKIITLDGQKYIGILSIPGLELELPVSAEVSDELLKKMPCRQYGSLARDHLVLAGHNYRSGFGKLSGIQKGTAVWLLDAEGRLHEYEVVDIEVLDADAVSEMMEEAWELTLYTCTFGGKSRLTVRCSKKENLTQME